MKDEALCFVFFRRVVAIDEVKKFVAKLDLESETRYVPPVVKAKIQGNFEQKIAIIGAGLAGMSCAYYLALAGFVNVTVFDKNPVPGGMLVTGVPNFRLEKDVLNAEIEVLKDLGVEFKMAAEPPSWTRTSASDAASAPPSASLTRSTCSASTPSAAI